MAFIYTVALPVITRQPRSTTVQVFSTDSSTCASESYGTVSLTWKKINSELPLTADITVSKSLNRITSTLKLESVGYYKGYYYCMIENSAGKVNSTFAYFDVTGRHLYVMVLLLLLCKLLTSGLKVLNYIHTHCMP